jgi:GNAT superfamily N-acetyltransferase
MLVVTPEDPSSPVAAPLLAHLTVEMAERYGDDRGAGFPASEVMAPRSVFLVSWFGGETVGCGALRGFDESTAEIRRIFVIERFRGRGIGRALLDELERFARQFGYARMMVEVGLRQPEAAGLFEKAGYERNRRKVDTAPGPHGLVFEKNLAKEGAANAGRIAS